MRLPGSADGPLVRYRVDGAVATIELNRPDQLNAITVGMLEGLEGALAQASAAPGVRVIVVTGAGRSFSAGVDLKALNGAALDGGKVGDLLDLPAHRVIGLMRTVDQVVVAKVRGHCYTGALELALAADVMAVATEAKLGDTHARWGLRPTWGMSLRLPLLVGLGRARLLSHTARTFSGAEAHAWGMAAVAAPDVELDAVVEDLLAQLVGVSPGSAAAYKRMYRDLEEEQIRAGLLRESGLDFEIEDTEERVQRFR